MPYRFAIVGGGLTATSMLCSLVDRFRDAGDQDRVRDLKLSIAVFEKKDVFGPGLPHNDRYVLPFHITNMCAKDMSVRPGVPGDFQDWVNGHSGSLQRMFPDLRRSFACPDCRPHQCRHYPRAVMGEYLKARFREAVRVARKLGVEVELHPGTEVVDLIRRDRDMLLTLKKVSSGASLKREADGVLLATGHWFESSGSDRYFSSPWPAEKLLAGIPAGETVGVIGSSLSAIEVALTLTSDGNFVRRSSGGFVFSPSPNPRKIVFHSRQGLFPRVRGRVGRRNNRHLTCDRIRRLIADRPGGLELQTIFELLNRELTEAYGAVFDWNQVSDPRADPSDRLRRHIREALDGDGPDGELLWQTVLMEIFPVARELYLNLTPSERRRFDREYNTAFFMHAATQPAVNAEKLLALLEAGIVSIVKLGRDYRFGRDEADGCHEFSYRGPGGRWRRDTYRYVVDARGQPRSVETDPARLTRNLLKRGLVRIQKERSPDRPNNKTGSMLVDPDTHRVLPAFSSRPAANDPAIFAVGAMVRGQMIDASMANGIARSTAAIADRLAGDLTGA